MDPYSNVWVQLGPDEVWSKAWVLDSFSGDNKLQEFKFTLQLQDESGIPIHDKIVLISTTSVGYSKSEFQHVKLRNSNDDESAALSVDDLTTLTHLHEPAIVKCLQDRFNRGAIYTSTGPILIAINPFKSLSIYDASTVNMYRNRKPNNKLQPHVFEIADDAFKNMAETRLNQSILVSGESGAGE